MMNWGILKSEDTVTEEPKSELSHLSNSSRVVFETGKIDLDIYYKRPTKELQRAAKSCKVLQSTANGNIPGSNNKAIRTWDVSSLLLKPKNSILELWEKWNYLSKLWLRL